VSERPLENRAPRFIDSPLRGKDLVSTFVAAQILFPHLPREQLTKSHPDFVQMEGWSSICNGLTHPVTPIECHSPLPAMPHPVRQ
jgi:hypothetical protein